MTSGPVWRRAFWPYLESPPASQMHSSGSPGLDRWFDLCGLVHTAVVPISHLASCACWPYISTSDSHPDFCIWSETLLWPPWPRAWEFPFLQSLFRTDPLLLGSFTNLPSIIHWQQQIQIAEFIKSRIVAGQFGYWRELQCYQSFAELAMCVVES